MDVVLFRQTPSKVRPILIIITALALALVVLGISLTIVGYKPEYINRYGSNPLKIVGPILLCLGVIGLIGVSVDCCVRFSDPTTEYEKPENKKKFSELAATKSSATAPKLPQYASSYAGSFRGGIPLNYSGRGKSVNNGSPMSTVPPSTGSNWQSSGQLPQKPLLYGNVSYQGTQPGNQYGQQGAQPSSQYGQQGTQPNSQYGQQGTQPSSQYGQQGTQPSSQYGQQGTQPGSQVVQQGTQPGSQWGQHGKQHGNQEVTKIDQAQVEAELQNQKNWEHAQQKYHNKNLSRQLSSVTEPVRKKTEAKLVKSSQANPPNSPTKLSSTASKKSDENRPKDGVAPQDSSDEKPHYWGSKSKLDRSDSKDSAEWKKSLPVLQIPIDIGEGKAANKSSSKSKGKASSAGEQKVASDSKVEHAQQPQASLGHASGVKSKNGTKYGSNQRPSGVSNEAFHAEENIPKESTPNDVAQPSTSKDRSRHSSHSKSRDTTPKSHQRVATSHGHDSSRDRSRDKASKSRESSRGRRSSFEDFTTMNFVSGVPLEKEARKKMHAAEDHSHRGDSHRNSARNRSRSHDQPKQSHINRAYDPDDLYARKRSPDAPSSNNSDTSRRRSDRHRHRHYPYEADTMTTTPTSSEGTRHHRKLHDISDTGTGMSDLLPASVETKNTTIVSPSFTININAQAGSAIQLGFGNQKFPPALNVSNPGRVTPMIQATPPSKGSASRPVYPDHSEA